MSHTLISPDGRPHVIEDVRAFCKEHGLSRANFYRVTRGERTHVGGWSLPENALPVKAGKKGKHRNNKTVEQVHAERNGPIVKLANQLWRIPNHEDLS